METQYFVLYSDGDLSGGFWEKRYAVELAAYATLCAKNVLAEGFYTNVSTPVAIIKAVPEPDPLTKLIMREFQDIPGIFFSFSKAV